MKKAILVKRKTKKVKGKVVSSFSGFYKFFLYGVVFVTLVSVGVMIWQYVYLQNNMWQFEELEIDMIEFERKEGLPLCGADETTKGSCINQKLSTPTSGAKCQTKNLAGAAVAGVTEAGCRQMAAQLRSWAGAFRTDSCQPGLLFDQKTITSDKLVDIKTGTYKIKLIDISGMHLCWPGNTGRYYPVKSGGKITGWKPYTTYQKGACKYGTEQPINIIGKDKMYKYCAPIGVGEVTLTGGTGCYTGSAAKPTVRLCCPAGKTITAGACN